jgi:DNA-binding protein HU-beta
MINKEAIVAHMAAATGMTKVKSQEAFDAALAAIQNGLINGQQVRLHGIGSLRTHMAGVRQSRNPRTGEAVTVPARREVRFRPAADLKRAVAGEAAA